MLEFGGRNDFEEDAWEFAAADHGVGDARGVALLVIWHGAAADLRPAFGMAAQSCADFDGNVGEKDGVFGAGCGVRDNRAVDEFVAPGGTEQQLVGPQESSASRNVVSRAVVSIGLRYHGRD